MKFVSTGPIGEIETTRCGEALIAEIDFPDADDCFFVRLQSLDRTKQHLIMEKLRGKRVRVTVEVIEEAANE
jgi:hypothetical protein